TQGREDRIRMVGPDELRAPPDAPARYPWRRPVVDAGLRRPWHRADLRRGRAAGRCARAGRRGLARICTIRLAGHPPTVRLSRRPGAILVAGSKGSLEGDAG